MPHQSEETIDGYILALEHERKCCRQYRNFFRCAWNYIEPETPLQENWHYDYLCDELQTQAERIDAGKKKEYDLIINIPPRSLKALSLDTDIPTPSGMKKLRDVHKGDVVFGSDGVPCRVIEESPVYAGNKCYEVEFATGEKIIADAGHLWETIARTNKPGGKRGPKRGSHFGGPRGTCEYKTRNHKARDFVSVRTTEEIASTVEITGRKNHAVSVAGGILQEAQRYEIDPYVLGVWLGDGTSANCQITIGHQDMELVNHIRATGEAIRWIRNKNKTLNGTFCLGANHRRGSRKGSFVYRLDGFKLRNNKHIPEAYFLGSYEQRLSLLQGLMDTDGTAQKKGALIFYNCNEQLSKDVKRLVCSLGFKAHFTKYDSKLNGRVVGIVWYISFMAYSDTPVFRLARKFERQKKRPRKTLQDKRYISNITETQSTPVKCLAVDSPNHQFLITDGYIPTHNSTLISKLLLPWVWTWSPKQKFLTSSYDASLSLEHAVVSRGLMVCDWYKELWGDKFMFVGDQNVKSFYRNDKGGHRISTSVGGSGTGRGGDWLIVDDPLSAEEAESEAFRDRSKNWWTRTMHKRLNDTDVGIRIIVMQRLHEDDLTGVILRLRNKHYKHICLPAEDSEDVKPAELRKKYVNGLLFPERLSHETLMEDKSGMGEYGYAGQMLQRPSPPEGGIFKRQCWKFWRPIGSNLPNVSVRVNGKTYTCDVQDLPESFDDYLISADMAFKDFSDSDYVAIGAWAAKGPKKYLLDRSKAKMNFSASLRATRAMKLNHPRANAILIEDKANGSAIISELQREIAGVIPIQPQGSKFARAMPISRQQEAGDLFLPHPSIAPWADPSTGDFVHEFCAFPHGSHDDDVDQSSQAINYLSGAVKVLKQYGGERIKFNINFKSMSHQSILICSQWVEPSLQSSMVMALWNPETMKLWVFEQVTSGNPQPEIVMGMANFLIRRDSGNFIQDMRPFEWYGNALMFARKGDSFRTNIREGMFEAYSRSGVTLRDNEAYDEAGAILLVSRLLAYKGLKIHDRCEELSRQMASWCIDGQRPADGYGLCRALCNMVSALWEAGKMEQHAAKLSPYSQKKESISRAMDMADNVGRLDEWIRTNQIPGAEDLNSDPNSWMSNF
jgi:predicted phage terminase large subunit-like protein